MPNTYATIRLIKRALNTLELAYNFIRYDKTLTKQITHYLIAGFARKCCNHGKHHSAILKMNFSVTQIGLIIECVCDAWICILGAGALIKSNAHLFLSLLRIE